MQVKRKELTPTTRKIVTNHKTEGFGKFLWEISLDAIDSKIKSLKKSKNPPHQNIIEGLSHIISTRAPNGSGRVGSTALPDPKHRVGSGNGSERVRAYQTGLKFDKSVKL